LKKKQRIFVGDFVFFANLLIAHVVDEQTSHDSV
jgi:hypothetical protein